MWNIQTFEPGELALFKGRLVEIIPSGQTRSYKFKFTDEGGIVWPMWSSTNSDDLQKQTGSSECALDALQKAAAPILDDYDQSARIAEIWFADPQVGDVFGTVNIAIEVVQLQANGGLTAQVAHRFWPPVKASSSVRVDWPSVKRFRAMYRNGHNTPGYCVRALSSRRPDFAKHPLLQGVK